MYIYVSSLNYFQEKTNSSIFSSEHLIYSRFHLDAFNIKRFVKKISLPESQCILNFFSAKFLKSPVSFNLILSLSLAASDGWSGLLIIMSLLLNRADVYYLLLPNDCILLTIEMLRLSSFSTSVFHLLALALNHFLGIVYPMQHKTLLHRRFEIAVLSFIWFIPPILLFCFAVFVPEQGFQSNDCENISFIQGSFEFRNVICAIIFIPMLITFGFYFAIVSSLRYVIY